MQASAWQTRVETSTPEAKHDILPVFDNTGIDGMFDQQHILKLANMKMPFGKYQGRVLVDLPDEYLLWFAKKGFPAGELGRLLQLCLEMKIEGLDEVIRPLKGMSQDQ